MAVRPLARLLVLLACVLPHASGFVPRRGAKRAVLLVVPGLNDAAWEVATLNKPLMQRMRKHGMAPSLSTQETFHSEHALGMELATGCSHGEAAGRDTVSAVWQRAGLATGVATTSCFLGRVVAPFAISAEVTGAYETAATLARKGPTPDVWFGGRAGAMDMLTVGGSVPKCVAENATDIDACVDQYVKTAKTTHTHVVGAFGEPSSVFARRCMFAPPVPSAATMVESALAVLQASGNDGWLLVAELIGVDRAAHANNTAKMRAALVEVGLVLDALARTMARDDKWDDDILLVVAGAYDSGGYDGVAFASAAHIEGGRGVLRTASAVGVVPDDEYVENVALRDIASLFSPALGCKVAGSMTAMLSRKPSPTTHAHRTRSEGSPLVLISIGAFLTLSILCFVVSIVSRFQSARAKPMSPTAVPRRNSKTLVDYERANARSPSAARHRGADV